MKNKLRLVFLTSLLLFTLINFSSAQKQAWKWYFGYNAAMDFSTGVPVVLFNSAMSQWEGCASIADANGDLLFYTDGIKSWNKNHTQMPNGFGMMGNYSSTQSAVIVPKPGSTTIYYIFATSGFDAYYSEVDMTLQSGDGDVTANKNILIAGNSAEKLAAVRQSNGTDLWVCMHKNNSADFISYSVTSGGVNATPVVSTTGSVMGGNIGQLQFSPDGHRAAMATLTDPNNTPIQVFTFNDSSGVFTFEFGLPLSVNQTYGVEFSPSQTILYSTGGDVGYTFVHQWNLAAGTVADIIASNTVIGTTVGYAGSLQLGPDNKMYVAQENYHYVGVINNPDTLGTGCDFDGMGVNLSPKTMGLGLPNFMASFFQQFSVEGVCFGDSTSFFITSTSNDSVLNWNFGDTASGSANVDTGTTVQHLFTAADTFNVSVVHTAFGGATDTSFKTVIIYEVPFVQLGNDTSICENDTLIINAGNSGATYLWSDGSSAQTLSITQPGVYAVMVSNGHCDGLDSIVVSTHPCPDQQVFLAATDTIVCEKFCLAFFDLSVNNPTAWQWSFPGGSPSSSTLQNPTNICYDNPGIYDVTLIVTTANGNDTLVLPGYITVNATPPFPTITQVGYTLTSSAADAYQWQFNSIDIPGATNQSYTISQSGLYTIVVSDSNGCVNSTNKKVVISGVDDIGDAAVSVYPNPSEGNFIVEMNGLAGNEISVDVINTLGQKLFSFTEKISSGVWQKQIDLRNVARGIYFIEIKTESEFFRKRILIAE